MKEIRPNLPAQPNCQTMMKGNKYNSKSVPKVANRNTAVTDILEMAPKKFINTNYASFHAFHFFRFGNHGSV